MRRPTRMSYSPGPANTPRRRASRRPATGTTGTRQTVVGDVETFEDDEALQVRADYLAGFADDAFLGGWYQTSRGTRSSGSHST
jgi:hypothetical protein